MHNEKKCIFKANNCIYQQKKCKPYLDKKSNHLLPKHFHGTSFSCTSSYESSWPTLIMESSFPFLSKSLSIFFKYHGWLIGCKIQHLSMRWPFLWQWVQNNCIFFSTWFPLSNGPLVFCLFCFESFLCMAILFQHLEIVWLLKPQK